MKSDAIGLQLQSLPESPGVYQFFDKDDNYLYVGKAKVIKKRVSSYFQKRHASGKLRVMVNKIVSIRHIVVNSENDALLLENNLIKTHRPKYNVLLKDDKSYPWICIKKERFPRIIYTRRLIKDHSEYFGPYTDMKSVRTLLELIRQLYPLRTCKYDLSPKHIESGKYSLCLEYHLKNCKAPCENLQSETDYLFQIRAIRNIIRGDVRACIKDLETEMHQQAGRLAFEDAQRTKEKITDLRNYQAKSTVVNPKIGDVDVFSVLSEESYAYVNFLEIKKGAVIRSNTLEIKKKLDECDEQILEMAIVELRNRFRLTSEEIIIPTAVSIQEGLKITVPKSGDKKQLLHLSLRNAKFFRREKLQKIRFVNPDRHIDRIMSQMKMDLCLGEEPRHIECFDNSNIQGEYPVAACVVFKNGSPSKKDYRRFDIKTVRGPNDFASMEEVVFRRYRRLLDEKSPLPQLIIIDGGKGQLSSAVNSLEALHLKGKIAILGIAKRLEEIYFPDDKYPLYLDKTSETLKVIQRLRDEAHRFGIGFHRDKRSRGALGSSLDLIPGVGSATQKKLLLHFESVTQIKNASQEELKRVVGDVKATKIFSFFR